MPAPAPPTPLHVLVHTRDGDTLVFDPRRSRAGYVQLWSTRKRDWRRFLAERVRPHLARVTDAAARDAALAAFAADRAAEPEADDALGDALVPAGARAALAAAAPRVVARRVAPASPDVDPDNAAQQRALALLDGRERTPLLLTGRAGTGKSTFLRALVARDAGRTVVLAPTGLAALNVGGQTCTGSSASRPTRSPPRR
jgi:transcriptional regulator of acetoin/glycerol metabolism